MFALTHLFAVLLLFVLLYASGALLLSFNRTPDSLALGGLLSRVTLGAIAWMAGLFALASVGLYRTGVVLPLAGAVLGLASYRALRRAAASAIGVREQFARIRLRAGAAGPALLCALPAAIVLASSFFQALTPHIGWDDNVYHLTLPKRYLAHGGFRPIPFSVFSHWPHAVELLYGLALMLSDQVLGKLVHGLFLALTLSAVYQLTRREASYTFAALATVLVLGNEVLLFEAPLAYVDIAFAFFFATAVACADEYLRTRRTGALWLSGLCCGAVAATKLSGFVALFCVGACVLVGVRFERARLREIALALLVPSLLLALPWYVKSYVYTGNPLYPFLYRQFGGIEWSEQLGRDFYAWQHGIGMGRTPHDYLLLPLRVVLDGGRGYHRFDGSFGKYWLGAVPLALLVSIFVRNIRVYVACACMYFVFWALSSQQARLLLPVLPPFAIAAALAAESLVKMLPFPAARAAMRIALVLGVALTALPALRPFCNVGLAAARQYFERGPEALESAVPQGYAYVNRNLPADAKLMLLNINRGFFLEREYIADSSFEASQMLWLISKAHSEAELNAVLRGVGITHIYIDNANWGIPFPPLWYMFLRDHDFVQREFRCSGGTCTIYRLRQL